MKILNLVKKFKSSPEKRAVAQLNRYIAKAESYGVGGLFKAAMIGITDNPITFVKDTDRISTRGFTIDMYNQLTSALGDFDAWISQAKRKVDAGQIEDGRKRGRDKAISDVWEEYYEVHDERGWRKSHKDWGSVVNSRINSLDDGVQDYLEKKLIAMGNKLRLDKASIEELNNLKNAIRDAKAGKSLRELREVYGNAN